MDNVRTFSLEAAACALTRETTDCAMLVETSNEGNSLRYSIMQPLGDEIVSELKFRDAAMRGFKDRAEMDQQVQQIAAAFKGEDPHVFGATITTFRFGSLLEVHRFGAAGVH